MDITELYAAHRLSLVQTLAPRQREVLVLRYWSHLSESEIARTLQVSQGTVKSTASRALVALQKTMREEER